MNVEHGDSLSSALLSPYIVRLELLMSSIAVQQMKLAKFGGEAYKNIVIKIKINKILAFDFILLIFPFCHLESIFHLVLAKTLDVLGDLTLLLPHQGHNALPIRTLALRRHHTIFCCYTS